MVEVEVVEVDEVVVEAVFELPCLAFDHCHRIPRDVLCECVYVCVCILCVRVFYPSFYDLQNVVSVRENCQRSSGLRRYTSTSTTAAAATTTTTRTTAMCVDYSPRVGWRGGSRHAGASFWRCERRQAIRALCYASIP